VPYKAGAYSGTVFGMAFTLDGASLIVTLPTAVLVYPVASIATAATQPDYPNLQASTAWTDAADPLLGNVKDVEVFAGGLLVASVNAPALVTLPLSSSRRELAVTVTSPITVTGGATSTNQASSVSFGTGGVVLAISNGVPTVLSQLTPCAAGSGPSASVPGTCVPCVEGSTFSITGAACLPCDDATAPGGTSCATCAVATGVCSACKPGNYLLAGVCTPCPVNTYSVGGVCLACELGKYSSLGSDSCNSCPAGACVTWRVLGVLHP
jgi:hypothetical protein